MKVVGFQMGLLNRVDCMRRIRRKHVRRCRDCELRVRFCLQLQAVTVVTKLSFLERKIQSDLFSRLTWRHFDPKQIIMKEISFRSRLSLQHMF